MEIGASPSGAGVSAQPGNGAAIVLRLLPFVHHPPARVFVAWDVGIVRALDARGYRVACEGVGGAAGADLPPSGFDLVCEDGTFAGLASADRGSYLARLADLLRPGGILFGAFPGGAAGELICLVADRFDVARLEPSAFAGLGDGWLEAVFVRR